jgi:hypothetical protein
MNYPTRNDYETAVRRLDFFVYDDILNQGKPLLVSPNSPFLMKSSGGKAVVFTIIAQQKKYALKCWIEDLGDLKHKYREIAKYLKQCSLPYFVDFSFNEKGILVNGNQYPIVRMEWVEGQNLKQFIQSNINDPFCIYQLAQSFYNTVQDLHKVNISHGDLQHGNIMVRPDNTVCLIDYDSCYVPSLASEIDSIKGLPGYQSPHRQNLSELHHKSDYFSEIVIYLSLLAISENTNYWNEIKDEERLIFSDTDLANPQDSDIFMRLKKMSPQIQYLTEKLEEACNVPDIRNIKPLESLLQQFTGVSNVWNYPSLITQTPNVNSQNTSYDNSLVATWDFNNPPVLNLDEIDKDKNDKTTNVDDEKASSSTYHSFQSQNSNIWNKFNQSSNHNSDIWSSRFGGSCSPDSDFITQEENQETETIKTNLTGTDKSIWNKFKDFRKSIVSIWNKFVKWFSDF